MRSLTDRMCAEFQCSFKVSGLYSFASLPVSMYCLKLCAGSLDAQHIRLSVCGERYVCVQGAMQKVLFPSLGLIRFIKFCEFWESFDYVFIPNDIHPLH